MSSPAPTAPPTAREIAKQLDRRRIKRRMTLWSALLALVAAGAMYLRCGGSGLGIGGEGLGGGDGPRRQVVEAHCTIRVSTAGLTVKGRSVSRDEAVAACKSAAIVDVMPTGDVRDGDVQAVHAALDAAGLKSVVHPPPRPAEEPAPGSGSAR